MVQLPSSSLLKPVMDWWGAATAAMLGFFGAGVGLVISIVLLRKLEGKTKLLLTLILTGISLMLWGVFQYKYNQRQKEKQQENVGLFGENKSNRTMNSPTALAMKQEPTSSSELHLEDGTEMGIGIVSILPEEGKVLRFYSKPEHFDLPETHSPADSLTFKAVQHYVDIATAPPWFVPQYMKLDYGFLQVVAVAVQRNWIQVIVNKTNGQTAWVYKEDVGLYILA